MASRLTKSECDQTAEILTATSVVFEGRPTKLVLNALVVALAEVIGSIDEERRATVLESSIKSLHGLVANKVGNAVSGRPRRGGLNRRVMVQQ
jgi:hypothetical protein